MLALYIHVPFCVRKCHYCGFHSSVYVSHEAELFISNLALEAEIVGSLGHAASPLSSIYIGGGTPTCLAEDQLEDLLTVIKKNFILVNNGEFTVEANPASLNTEKLMRMKEAGVNRLSIGIQSFDDGLLKTLGRAHNAMQGVITLQDAQAAGFENISLDLIYGIPGQSGAQWKESLDRAVSLGPQHISAYILSVDEHTQFQQYTREGTFALPTEEVVLDQYAYAIEFLREAGYRQYEISNFALPGLECRHNKNYWGRGEYLGLGPGAWSFIGGRRTRNTADLKLFASSMLEGVLARDFEEKPGLHEAARESIFLGLRTMQGMDLSEFLQAYGETLMQQLELNIAELRGRDLIRIHEGRLQLTECGILLSDEVVARISP